MTAAYGYTPIEFDIKTSLGSFCADPRHVQIALPILEFIRIEACRRLKTDQLEVIRVEYFGSYPCLALRGSQSQLTVPRVLVEIDAILREMSLGAFVDFIERGSIDWRARAAEFQSDRR